MGDGGNKLHIYIEAVIDGVRESFTINYKLKRGKKVGVIYIESAERGESCKDYRSHNRQKAVCRQRRDRVLRTPPAEVHDVRGVTRGD